MVVKRSDLTVERAHEGRAHQVETVILSERKMVSGGSRVAALGCNRFVGQAGDAVVLAVRR